MERRWRVAVATRDGKVVGEHFGRASAFYIVDISPDGTCGFTEKRPVTPLCQAGEHTEQGLASSVSALSDCCAVLVARIGTSARRALELNRIAVFEQPDLIDSALGKLAKYFIQTNFAKPEA